MNMYRILTAATAALSIAACGQPVPQPANETGNEAGNVAAAAPAPPPAAPANGLDTGAPTPANTIPAVLQGRWGLVAADCTSTRGDAKGLLEVNANELRFYESRATLRAVTESASDRIAGEFDFEGEGQTWQRLVILESEDGGRTLVRREAGEGAMAEALRYRRCGG